MALDERTGAIILLIGSAITAIGLMWLIIRLFPVLRTIIARGFKPGLVILLGVAIIASPYAINKYFPPENKPIANVTTGERDLTLTDKAGLDYAKELSEKNWTILQLANPDVTDATVELLRPMVELKRLDLSRTAITDKSLELLATLPKLEDLKLTSTKITDAGLKKFLETSPSIRSLTVDGTDVKTATLRAWKNADPNKADPNLMRKYIN